MSSDLKKDRAKEFYFLVLGITLGIAGNFLVSALVEAINATIASVSNLAKMTFWLGAFCIFSLPIVWVAKKGATIMMEAKIWNEKDARKLIEESNSVRKLALISGTMIGIAFVVEIILSL